MDQAPNNQPEANQSNASAAPAEQRPMTPPPVYDEDTSENFRLADNYQLSPAVEEAIVEREAMENVFPTNAGNDSIPFREQVTHQYNNDLEYYRRHAKAFQFHKKSQDWSYNDANNQYHSQNFNDHFKEFQSVEAWPSDMFPTASKSINLALSSAMLFEKRMTTERLRQFETLHKTVHQISNLHDRLEPARPLVPFLEKVPKSSLTPFFQDYMQMYTAMNHEQNEGLKQEIGFQLSRALPNLPSKNQKTYASQMMRVLKEDQPRVSKIGRTGHFFNQTMQWVQGVNNVVSMKEGFKNIFRFWKRQKNQPQADSHETAEASGSGEQREASEARPLSSRSEAPSHHSEAPSYHSEAPSYHSKAGEQSYNDTTLERNEPQQTPTRPPNRFEQPLPPNNRRNSSPSTHSRN